ncbi:ABC transporter ATP-binding protein [Synechococcus sp. ROS8604]|uniref:ATP-binding cassette domain-containing protein n=1 Tax=Synechococcus sp. ROS8604 TaxID=1442557 RepID=UPI001646175F|nr:ABC transporter ATP-binding protein [Synechococcus sp. ROS8604]QNI86955.1 ABC transporter type 1/ ATPase component [Synechococcus sp. ROS8604]
MTSLMNNIIKYSKKLQKKAKFLKSLYFILSKENKKNFLFLVVVSIASSFINIIGIGLTIPFLEIISKPEELLANLQRYSFLSLLQLNQNSLLILMCIAYVLINIIALSTRIYCNNFALNLSSAIGTQLATDSLSQILKKPYIWHKQSNSSDVLSLITNNVEQTQGVILSLTLVVPSSTLVLLIAFSLILIDPINTAVISFLLIIYYVYVLSYTSIRAKKNGVIRVKEYAKVVNYAQEFTSLIKELILQDSFDFNIKNYRNAVFNFRSAIADNKKLQSNPKIIIEYLFIIILLLTSTISYFLNPSASSLAIQGTFLISLARIIQPLQQIFSAFNGLFANDSALVSVLEAVGSKTYDAHSISSKHKGKDYGHFGTNKSPNLIELNNVSFKYSQDPDDSYQLRNINFRIRLGESVAFIGKTGSGKSTCLDIIMGLLKPTSGNVQFKGNDIYASVEATKRWQNSFSHIAQDFCLNDASIMDNISNFQDIHKANFNDILLASKLSEIHAYIEALPDSYDTRVGERGSMLSGGQRQRISLARAIFRARDIMFLDEATSAMDRDTELKIIQNLKRLNYTLLAITHSRSILPYFDKIVLFSDGTILDVGTYSELTIQHPGLLNT